MGKNREDISDGLMTAFSTGFPWVVAPEFDTFDTIERKWYKILEN